MKRVGLIGASGYTGLEVRRLLGRHGGMELVAAMTARPQHVPDPPTLPHDAEVEPLDLDRLGSLDGVFLCTPHGAAAELARAALDAQCAVVDLSADFRLRDPDVYADTYGQTHPAPELLDEAVYGLTEQAREQIAAARLVANPGCYPTSILLPLLPLLRAGLLDAEAPIIADSKSGVSGAGKTPTERTVFGSLLAASDKWSVLSGTAAGGASAGSPWAASIWLRSALRSSSLSSPCIARRRNTSCCHRGRPAAQPRSSSCATINLRSAQDRIWQNLDDSNTFS